MSDRTPIDVEQLRRLEPLSALSNERLRELVSLAYVEPLIMGVSVFREGDVDNQTVYLVSGDVQLLSSDGSIDRAVTSRAKESRFPLDDSQPRQSSCTALTNVEIVRIDNSVLDYMMMWDQLAESPVEPQVEPQPEPQPEPQIESQAEAQTAATADEAESKAEVKPEPTPQDESTRETSTENPPSSDVSIDTDSALPAVAKPVPAQATVAKGQSDQESVTSAPAQAQSSPAPSPAMDKEETTQRISQPTEAESVPPVSSPVATPAPTAAAADSPKPGRPGEWIRKMHHIMAFKNLPPANVKALLEKMERVPMKSGETVVQQGELGDYYYVLVDGEAAVTRTIDLADLSAGASFGEESLVSGAERNATVTMKTNGAVMRLSKDDFNDLLREPMISRVSPEEARSQVLMGAIWLDVRHAREYQHGHFRGALNMPLHEMRLRMDELDPNAHYICCCRTGHRSSAAAFLLVQRGFHASVLTGGIQVMPQDLQKAPTPTSDES